MTGANSLAFQLLGSRNGRISFAHTARGRNSSCLFSPPGGQPPSPPPPHTPWAKWKTNSSSHLKWGGGGGLLPAFWAHKRALEWRLTAQRRQKPSTEGLLGRSGASAQQAGRQDFSWCLMHSGMGGGGGNAVGEGEAEQHYQHSPASRGKPSLAGSRIRGEPGAALACLHSWKPRRSLWGSRQRRDF